MLYNVIYIYIYISDFTGLVLLGKSEPETHGFLPSNWLGFPVNFPIIQFYED